MSQRARLVSVALATLIVTTVYELVKQALAPQLTSWESHGVTIVFVTALGTAVAHLALKRADAMGAASRSADVSRAKSEAALRAFVNALPEPAFLIDASKTCLAANQAMAARLGRTVDEVIGHDIFAFVPEQVAESRIAHIDEVMRTGKPVVFTDERRGRHYANHIFPGFDQAGKVWCVAAVAIDVTEVREAEQRLAEREELLRFGFEAARMGVWEWDPAADNVVISKELVERIGVANLPGPAGALAWFLRGIHPDDQAAVETSLRDCAAGRMPLHHVKYRSMRASDGRLHWYEAWGRLFTDAKGRARIVGTLLEITSEMEAEAREREAHEKVRHSEERYRVLSEQLEKRVAERTVALSAANQELEAFCYSVSHDLRAPLRAIDGFSLALMEDYGDRLDGEAHKYLGIVRTETQRMGTLIDDLLNLSRVTRTAMNRVSVDLGALAGELIDAERGREPGRQADISIAPDLIVTGDEPLLRIALDNLVSNAWKFTRRRPIARIEVGQTTSDGKRVFYVRDNGAGFEMEHAGKLFEPFQRLHNVAEFDGTGVGLATVNRIIRRHGGSVWAQGKVGEGATFFWTLPDLLKEAS